MDYHHDNQQSNIVLTTNELHKYDYLHASKMETDSKLAKLQTDFDSLSMEYERLKPCFVITGVYEQVEKLG